ncbi:MAG: TIGR03915 family putative DNA repair protein [Bacteroidota bacterium]
MILLYDGSYTGFLSAVFEVFRLKLDATTDIQPEANYQEQLFASPLPVTSNEQYAARIKKGLNKKCKKAAKYCYRAFLSEHPDRELILLHFIRRFFAEGHEVIEDLTDRHIRQLNRLDQQMGREVHRMHAFVRFQQTPDNLYAALINPDFDVLPLLDKHFIARYPAQDWLIYDTKRHYGLHWNQKTSQFVTFSENNHQHLRQLSKNVLTDRETGYQQLWQTYFRSVDIPERRNMKLHLQHVPRRYWKYLVEKWG